MLCIVVLKYIISLHHNEINSSKKVKELIAQYKNSNTVYKIRNRSVTK